MRTFINEFKAFISRGNVVDLAVAVVIGAAFGKVVNSFVEDVLMPPIGLILDGVNFNKLAIQLTEGVSIRYGAFINTLITFVIIAFSVFLVIKALAKLRKQKEADPTEKTCPDCCFKIPAEAKKCGHCGCSQ